MIWRKTSCKYQQQSSLSLIMIIFVGVWLVTYKNLLLFTTLWKERIFGSESLLSIFFSLALGVISPFEILLAIIFGVSLIAWLLFMFAPNELSLLMVFCWLRIIEDALGASLSWYGCVFDSFYRETFKDTESSLLSFAMSWDSLNFSYSLLIICWLEAYLDSKPIF